MCSTHLVLTGQNNDFDDFSGVKRQSLQLQHTVLGDDLLDGTSCFSKGIRKPKTRNLYAENGRFIGDHYLVEAICEHEKVTAETARKWLAEHAASLREILNQAQCLTKGRETKCL